MTLDPILSKSIDITDSILKDAYNLNKNQFISKHSVKPDSPLSIESVYRRLREYIVDNKLKIND